MNGKRDLVLHLGDTADTPVAVVPEVKGPKNPKEMPAPDDLNRKAMQQLYPIPSTRNSTTSCCTSWG